MSSAKKIVEVARQAFATNKTKPVEWRIGQLKRLLDLISENHDLLVEAVKKDLNKAKLETVITELIVTKNEIVCALNNIHQWTKPTYVKKTLLQKLDTLYLQKQPLGVVLIMSAWNYPMLLIFSPLVAAITAGNCAVLKPSEISEASANLIGELIPKYLDKDCFHVLQGGIPETTALLAERFDHILYTGGSFVGKIVMTAAAKHLTPVTLELGGKSPVYVHDDSYIDIVANRVAWGKWVNCGQTCTTADYILCHKNVVDKFCLKMKEVVVKMYGENPKQSPDYGRIVNERNFKRIAAVMDKMKKNQLFFGGDRDQDSRYIAPVLYRDVTMEDPIMESEIFGPILPVVAVSGPGEAIEIINKMEKPLALYVFSNNQSVVEEILSNTSSGGSTVNDVLMHSGVANLPFGGVGNSGMGAYHGKWGFDTFTHERPVWARKQNMEALVMARYPPYNDKNLASLEWLMTEKPGNGYCNIL